MALIAQTETVTANLKLPLFWRLANSMVVYVAYLGQFFCPLNLALYYPHPANRLAIWKIAASVVVLLAISAGVAAGRRRHPYLLTGWLWYLGMLVPVIGLIQVGGQAMADRYTYLPLIGIVVALVWGVDDLRRFWAWRPTVIAVVSVLLLLGLMAVAGLQTSYWYDGVSLWRHSLACTTENVVAHEGLAETLSEMGQIDDAIAEYRVALKIGGPDPIKFYNLGVAFDRADRTKEAAECYEQTLQLRWNYPHPFRFGKCVGQRRSPDRGNPPL